MNSARLQYESIAGGHFFMLSETEDAAVLLYIVFVYHHIGMYR